MVLVYPKSVPGDTGVRGAGLGTQPLHIHVSLRALKQKVSEHKGVRVREGRTDHQASLGKKILCA